MYAPRRLFLRLTHLIFSRVSVPSVPAEGIAAASARGDGRERYGPRSVHKADRAGIGGFPPASLAAKGGDVRNDLRLIDLLPFPLRVAAANAGLWRTQADDPVQDIAAVRLLIEGDIAWLHAAIEPP